MSQKGVTQESSSGAVKWLLTVLFTFFPHFGLQTLLKSTELTLIPPCNVHNTVSKFFANINQVAADAPFEKSSFSFEVGAGKEEGTE